jgi:hypothetical protein
MFDPSELGKSDVHIDMSPKTADEGVKLDRHRQGRALEQGSLETAKHNARPPDPTVQTALAMCTITTEARVGATKPEIVKGLHDGESLSLADIINGGTNFVVNVVDMHEIRLVLVDESGDLSSLRRRPNKGRHRRGKARPLQGIVILQKLNNPVAVGAEHLLLRLEDTVFAACPAVSVVNEHYGMWGHKPAPAVHNPSNPSREVPLSGQGGPPREPKFCALDTTRIRTTFKSVRMEPPEMCAG